MRTASLLRWIDVEAYCSWCHAKGRAGEYGITWSFSEPGHTLSLPNCPSEKYETRDRAKEAAEKFEREYCEKHPEQMTLGRFWMVHGIGQGVPRFIHHSEEGARREARRLAEINPNITFVVLQSITAYRAETPKINQFEIVEPSRSDSDDIPF